MIQITNTSMGQKQVKQKDESSNLSGNPIDHEKSELFGGGLHDNSYNDVNFEDFRL